MTTQPVAIFGGIEELRQRVAAGHRNFAIMLAGGAAISRKRISRKGDAWLIANAIDDSKQRLRDAALWTESNIGEALDKHALLDMDGDTDVVRVKGEGIVPTEVFAARVREDAEKAAAAEAEENARDPLRYRLAAAPGSIRMGVTSRAEWMPADPTLVIERMEIGPSTVASIDLAATSTGPTGRAANATTSIELTMEDIEAIVGVLVAIRLDAIDHRNFALNAEGYWTNGEE